MANGDNIMNKKLKAFLLNSGSSGNGLSSGLISYYKYDTNANDAVGSNNGTLHSATIAAGGIINSGLNLATGGQYVSVVDAANLSFGNNTVDVPFSISFWINPTGVTGSQILFSKYNGTTDNEYLIQLLGNKVLIELFSQSLLLAYLDVRSVSGVITLGVWNHIVVTYSGNSAVSGIKVYVNAALSTVDTTNSVGSYVAMNAGAIDLYICTQSANPGNVGMPGMMDEVGIWRSRELSAANVTALYNSGSGLSQTLFT